MQYQHFIILQSQFATHRFARPSRRARLEEVVNNFNRVLEIQEPMSFMFQESGNRSHRVGTIQRVADGRAIPWILAQESRVGAMQCRDHFWPPFGWQHLASED